MDWQASITLDSYRANSEDRASVVKNPSGIVCILADGVGGRSGGGEAAEYFVQSTSKWVKSLNGLPRIRELYRFLRDLDEAMTQVTGLGETTGLITVCNESDAFGVVVGDSTSWWVAHTACDDLTENVGQKPWLGSGMARIGTFERKLVDGTLLMATDGLSKYADRETLCNIVRQTPLNDCGKELVAAVRPPSGRLPDDVAIIVARRQ